MKSRPRRSARRQLDDAVSQPERGQLAGSDLNRSSHAGGRRPPRARPPRGRIEAPWRRALALLLAVLEIAALVWASGGNGFRVHRVEISGLAHLGRAEVVAAAGLDRPVSVARLDGATIRRNLERLPWVRTASAQPLLPDQVLLTVEEWQPVAVYRGGASGRLFYLNDQATALAPAESGGGLFLVQGPGPDPKVGTHPIDTALLAALVQIVKAFPSIYGSPIAQFELDCVGALTASTGRGVRILFGRVLTPEEFASLSAKLSALKSIAAADPDVRNPDRVEYINLEDVQQPAVKFKGDRPPPSPSPPPGARPSPSPSPAVIGPAPVVVGPLCR